MVYNKNDNNNLTFENELKAMFVKFMLCIC
jgi:hypothetical protein